LSDLGSDRFTFGTHGVVGCMGPTAGLDQFEETNALPLPEIEQWFLGCPFR